MPATGKRRALGQHFLRDRSVIAKIVERTIQEASAAACPALLEIGPGRGALTEPLIAALAAGTTTLILSERDRQLVEDWRARAAAFPWVRVEAGDFLELPRERWLGRTPLGVVSNLPYSAGTAICTRLAAETSAIPFMVLMFQAEVARRLRAEASTKAWGSLSIWIQNRWDVEKVCAVPPRAFVPPPAVDSEVVVLKRRASPRVAVAPEREAAWEGLLRATFAHRRKMLRSSLPSPYAEAFARSGIDGTLRAEALSWEQWAHLFGALVG